MNEPPASPPAGPAGSASPAAPGWKRLWQPRRPAFWLLVAFNLMSSACAWALRALPLHDAGMLLIGSLGLLNAIFGLIVAWRLWHGH